MLITLKQNPFILCAYLLETSINFREWNSYLRNAYLFNLTTNLPLSCTICYWYSGMNSIRNVASITILIVYSTLSCASQPISLHKNLIFLPTFFLHILSIFVISIE